MSVWRELGKSWYRNIATVADELNADSAYLYGHFPKEKQLHLLCQQSPSSNPPRILNADDPAVYEILHSQHPFSGERYHYGETFLGFSSPYLLVSSLKLEKRIMGLLLVGRKRNPSPRDVELFSGKAAQVSLLLLLDSYEKEKRELDQRCASLEQKLTSAYQQLFEANRLAGLGQFAGGIAHEINTPLGAIQTYAEYLQLFVSGEAERESVEGILKAVSHCRDVVQSVLWLSREERRKLSPVSLQPIIQEALALSEPLMKKGKIHVKTGFLFNPVILGNRTALIQVVTNLLTNARDAVLRSRLISRKGEIRVSLWEEKSMSLLEIADNGPGIPKEIAGKISAPFFTTKPIGEGMGLGLSICHSILEDHHGTLEVFSEEGKGARVLMKIPLADQDSIHPRKGENNGQASCR